MARIKAFFGYRPPKSKAQTVAAPPYDVINSQEARAMAAGNPESFLHINKPEIDLDPAIGLYSDIVYATGKANLARFIETGLLVRDAKPCLYAYAQTMGDHTQLGLMACAHVDDYDADNIKKHEHTRKDKEDDRARHVDETNCNAGPVFLTYRAEDRINALLARATSGTPDADIIDENNMHHVLWPISDEALIAELVAAFAAVPVSYVADGHHRAKSASRVRAARQAQNPNHTGLEEYNWFMAVYFPHDQLKILDYNRLVKDLNGLTPEAFMAKVEEKFEVNQVGLPKPDRLHDIGMYLGGKWYRLRAKPESFDAADPIGSLDVTILQNNLLTPILGIGDPRTDKRIDFVGGIRGTVELVKRVEMGEMAVAFAMYATTMEQLMAIADAGAIMPPKSTWFEPKLKSGLVVHLLS